MCRPKNRCALDLVDLDHSIFVGRYVLTLWIIARSLRGELDQFSAISRRMIGPGRHQGDGAAQ